MIEWVSANLASVLLMALVIALIIVLICVKIKQRKKGACCCGCSNCRGCKSQHKGGVK
ncbi:MAG: FeoB-associated Cys-rich membrane protein [Clostridiales bacterium]|nr:FeoB-associated Cys-rich membrane protein [Clostridiales bacterium]